MKINGAVFLFYICMTSVKVPQTVGDDGIETKEMGTQTNSQTASPDSNQRCQQDMHAVLRELSALIAEQKVELKYTQSALQAVEARLKASEDQVESLKTENAAQGEQLLALKSKSFLLETLVDALKQDNERKVAFSVALRETDEGYTGPFNTDTIVVYKHIMSNVGNGYNPNTGIFTAPVKGVYMIKATSFAYGSSSGGNAAGLTKNGQHLVSVYANQAAGTVNAANGVTVLLEVGDVVYMRLFSGHRLYDNQHHHTTFSGHLLFSL